MNEFELNTTIANLRDLKASDLNDYDAVYLGDIYCRLYESNFLEQLGDLEEGLSILRDQGKRAYVTTYAAPRNDFLPKVRKMLEASLGGGRSGRSPQPRDPEDRPRGVSGASCARRRLREHLHRGRRRGPARVRGGAVHAELRAEPGRDQRGHGRRRFAKRRRPRSPRPWPIGRSCCGPRRSA